MKRIYAPVIAALLLVSLLLCLFACAPASQPAVQTAPQPVAPAPADPKAVENTEPPVTLRIGSCWSDCRALEWAAAAFKEAYPNCTVVYEYLQGDYNETLLERMQSEGDDRIDLFVTTTNIQEGHALVDSALDLMSREDLDLSEAFPSLIENYKYIEPDGSPATKLYAIPLGAQMRGLFINVSLLKQVGIEKTPANQAELLSACAKLKEAGYIPFHGDPGVFAQQLLYPWICNQVANAPDYQKAYTLVNTRDIAGTELFRDIYDFMYTLVENEYYDYYYAANTLDLCKNSATETYARSLLNIVEIKDAEGEGTGEYAMAEGVGQVAFMPSAISSKPIIDQMKEDYHSDTEYVFVPAPVGKDGGYVYLSPADAIGVNKYTEKAVWAVRFLDFLFKQENNEHFAELFSVMPNTKDAFSYISSLYDVPADHISELGQATFDWSFYRTLTRSAKDDVRALPAISRANAPDNLDPATKKIYPFEHFWAQFQAEFTGAE